MRGLLAGATGLALVPLILVIYYLIYKGIGQWSVKFFTTDPNGNFLGYPGGIRSAILGSIEIVALASLIAVPLGIAVALYLVEYGKKSLFANVVRYFVDVMTGVPSIVFGLFIYIVLIASHIGGNFTGWKGSLAIALVMLPIGAPRWRVVTRVVLPTAAPGLLTGSLLAIARGAGETAPLLFTILGANALTLNLSQQMNALPLQIFNDITSPRDAIVARAWGAALTLVAMILILNLIARAAQRRSRMA